MTERQRAWSPRFESPVVSTYRVAEDPAVRLLDLSELSKVIVRAGPETPAAARLGVGFGRSVVRGQVLIAGQRPDEWLVLGSEAEASTLVDSIDRTGHVTVLDLTHGRALFRLTGEGAASVLAAVCDLDWHDNMTPDGAVVSGLVGGVTCDIIRHDVGDGPSYLVACDRSLGQFLFDVILDAGGEHGIGVVD